MAVTLSDAPWPCAICRRPMNEKPGFAGVPAALYPEKSEPLHRLAGRMVHKDCFEQHPAAVHLRADIEQFNAAVQRRRCVVCDQAIELGRRGGFSTRRLGPALGPYGALNFLQFHEACLTQYAGLQALIEAVSELLKDEKNPTAWLGELSAILAEAREGIAPRNTLFFQ